MGELVGWQLVSVLLVLMLVSFVIVGHVSIALMADVFLTLAFLDPGYLCYQRRLVGMF